MNSKNNMKGGEKKMVKDQGIIYKENCEFCSKEFKALNENQALAYKRVHELTCPARPSILKENVKN